MRISSLEDYCLRCLSQLARHPDRRLTIGFIAAAEGLTEENTAKILARLRDAGLINSFRGKDGGYVLARPAEQISVAEVLSSISGVLFEDERCNGSDSESACVHQGDCGIRPVWLTLQTVVNRFLSSVSLADLVQPERQVVAQLNPLAKSVELNSK